MEPLSRNYETHFALGTKKKGGDQIGRMGSIADRSIQRRRKAKKKTSVAVGKPKKKKTKKKEKKKEPRQRSAIVVRPRPHSKRCRTMGGRRFSAFRGSVRSLNNKNSHNDNDTNKKSTDEIKERPSLYLFLFFFFVLSLSLSLSHSLSFSLFSISSIFYDCPAVVFHLFRRVFFSQSSPLAGVSRRERTT